MRLVSRYVLRECVGACVLVILVLLVILMGNQFAQVLGDAAADQLPRDAVFSVFALASLRYLTLLAPVGLFIGTLFALGRLSRDSEMAVLSACGVGPVRLLWPVGVLALCLALISGWLGLVRTPQAMQQIAEIRDQAKQALKLTALEPGQFASPDSGNTVLYARAVEGDELRGVFLERHYDGRVVAIRAARGERKENPATGQLSFVLHDGIRYEGVPGSKQFSIVKFGEQGIPVRTTPKEAEPPDPATKTTAALIRSSNPYDRAELERRLATPISLFVLAIFAVALGRFSPREGRSMRIGVGLFIYIIYVNALSVGLVWVQHQMVPSWAGLWCIHVLMAAIGLIWLGRQAGWFAPGNAAEAVP